MDIKGIGVIIRGDSGGARASAHGPQRTWPRQVADDVVYIKRSTIRELDGTSSDTKRG
jgi:serine kinase of HPr protein (carbohydrate metabolism regulator)